MGQAAKDFIAHLISLTRKELEIDRDMTTNLLSGSSLELQKKGVVILDLKIKDITPGVASTVNLEFGVDTTQESATNKKHKRPRESQFIPPHRLHRGDMIAIQTYNRLDEIDNIVQDAFWTAIIVHVQKDSITVSVDVDKGEENVSILLKLSNFTGFVKIVKLPNNITHTRILDTLTSLLANNKKSYTNLTLALLGIKKPAGPSRTDSVTFFDIGLNNHQKDAVRASLFAPHLQLIHGPPGKTHTLVEIIRQLVAQKKRILVCGPSNISVDNLLERIIVHRDIKSVRVGHPARVSPSVVEVTLDVLACTIGSNEKDKQKFSSKIKDSMQTLSNQLRKSSKVATENEIRDAQIKLCDKLFKHTFKKSDLGKVIRRSHVVFSTLSGAGSRVLKNFRKFDVVIIDEAAQATEPDCWVALTRAYKAILAGDHLQLPPTVITPRTQRYDERTPVGMSLMTDLSYTLFDRLLDMYGNKIKQLLCIQYRMHEKIMRFSSDELYEGKLIAHDSVAKHTILDLKNVPQNGSKNLISPIITIDTSDADETLSAETTGRGFERASIANHYEADLVVQHIWKLISAGVKYSQMGVIAPYRAQIADLRQAIGERWPDIEVGTVDGFQGREKEIILLSLVRSNPGGHAGFLAEKRRLNVAMTRAKRNLVIICNKATLSQCGKESFLAKWMTWLATESEVRPSTKTQIAV